LVGEEFTLTEFKSGRYGDIFSDTINVNKGIVSANRDLGGDTGQFQIDAAVQPGNSGGPIYDCPAPL
jgi:S1-C subfamily serine protease